MKASNYQCVNCQISFGIEGDYISHYKSEHHRYNIKRKLIGLPPVTFQQYHLEFQDEKTSKHSALEDFYCEICCKKFMNGGTYKQHISSKKHKLQRDQLKRVGQYNSRTLSKSSSSSDFSIIGAQKAVLCLFCQSEGTKEHMKRQHCFPPFQLQCVEYVGLFNHVKQKISKLECIFCHLKFNSEQSVKQHMKDTGHTKLNIDHFGQYEQFYLWKISQTEEDSEQQSAINEMSGKGQVKANEKSAHPTLESLQEKRLERIQLTLTGAIINGKQVGYRHLKQYYKQYLNRELPNLRKKYQPALEMDHQQQKVVRKSLHSQPKICINSHSR